jgi:hypothetical protein
MYNFNLRNCINEPTRFGALLDPIIYSDECEISFSDIIQIDRNISWILYLRRRKGELFCFTCLWSRSLIRIAFLIDELNQIVLELDL